jgi:uncharacterized protein involved in outer membrane biogenesis
MSTLTAFRSSRLWIKLLVGLMVVILALVLLAVFFPWDVLRGPINRYVSEKTGREFAITRRLEVKLGRTTRVFADGIEFANPDWAVDRHLVKAQAAEVHVRLFPLLFKRQIEMPLVRLTKPELGLQMEPDGRRTWALGSDTKDERNVPSIGALVVDEGNAHFVARQHGADIRTDFAMDRREDAGTSGVSPPMPLRFRAKGQWQNENFSAEGRTGDVLYLSAPLQQPFPAEVHVTAGRTNLRAKGTVASLATLDGANVNFQLQGANLGELYKLVGVVLPETPRFAVAGQLAKQGDVWRLRQMTGKLGNTDLAGEMSFDKSGNVPQLAGQLHSRALDFDDLAPLIGMKEQPTARQKAAAPQGKRPRDPNRKVLPTTKLDVARLQTMNADVRFSADKIVNAKQLPLDRASVHARLTNGVLQLEPLDLGVAGGRMTGRVRIDSKSTPVAVQLKLDGRGMELNRLFPGSQLTRASFGKIHGEIDLTGQGSSVAQMLGGASGNVAMLMGRGQISNLLMELMGLDGAEIIKFLMGGDTNVQLRCAATAFNVDKGRVTTRAFVLDTEDTVFYGDGVMNLAQETMDFVLRPYPKDMSILSLRSPLKLHGTLGAPQGGLDKGALASRAGLAIALGAINPLLALAATVETGPGLNADCATALRDAATPQAASRAGGNAPAGQREGSVMNAARSMSESMQPGRGQAQKSPSAGQSAPRSSTSSRPSNDTLPQTGAN